MNPQGSFKMILLLKVTCGRNSSVQAWRSQIFVWIIRRLETLEAALECTILTCSISSPCTEQVLSHVLVQDSSCKQQCGTKCAGHKTIKTVTCLPDHWSTNASVTEQYFFVGNYFVWVSAFSYAVHFVYSHLKYLVRALLTLVCHPQA